MAVEPTAVSPEFDRMMRIRVAASQLTAAYSVRPRNSELIDAAREVFSAVSAIPVDEDRVASAQAEHDRIKAAL